MNIQFINHGAERCGVADYGYRLWEILKRSNRFTHNPEEPADVVLYNYHHATLPQSDIGAIKQYQRRAKHIALHHEGPIDAEFDKIIKVEDLPRPLFEDLQTLTHFDNTPYIGSFGFGFGNKGYSHIARLVRDQYPEGAALRLHIPFAEFGDNDGVQAASEVQKVADILGRSKITLKVSHEYKDHKEMLRWLKLNDLNLFLYDDMPGRGLSSTIDYALSVKRPIGISNSCMFRHIYKPEIDANLNSLQSIIDRGIEPLREAYEHNSNQKLIEYFERELCTE